MLIIIALKVAVGVYGWIWEVFSSLLTEQIPSQ